MIQDQYIAILNQLCNCCRGNPPVVARSGVGTGALPLQILMNDLGLLCVQNYAFERNYVILSETKNLKALQQRLECASPVCCGTGILPVLENPGRCRI